MLAHYDDYLQEYGSLGKFMNQGAEAKHKEGVLAFHRIGGGGIVGRVKKDNIRPDAEFGGVRLRKKLDVNFQGEKQADLADGVGNRQMRRDDRGEKGSLDSGGEDEEAGAPINRDEMSGKRTGLGHLKAVRDVGNGLMLLNFVRLYPYCEEHDEVNCKCGGTSSSKQSYENAKMRRKMGMKHIPRVELGLARQDLHHILSLKQEPEDESAPSPRSAGDIIDAAADQDLLDGDKKEENCEDVEWPRWEEADYCEPVMAGGGDVTVANPPEAPPIPPLTPVPLQLPPTPPLRPAPPEAPLNPPLSIAARNRDKFLAAAPDRAAAAAKKQRVPRISLHSFLDSGQA
jgi:hypothetical protein